MSIIRVKDLQYTYPGAPAPTLHDLSFEVGEQEIVGFLGPSGAGKSTTQKILIGLLKGYQGSAEVMGKQVSDWGSEYYEEIGVSFELPNHHQKLTALENLQHFGSLYAGERMDPLEALALVDLKEDANKKVSDFSKGMKIRLNVARSLLHKPKLLFLDEPTSGLDPVNAQRVKQLVLDLREKGVTVVITTHDMNVADQLCDRVAFITSGRLREIDAPAVLKARHGRRVLRVDYGEGGVSSQEFEVDGLAQDEAFLELIGAQHIERMHTQETTLEQVFIDVTGEELKG